MDSAGQSFGRTVAEHDGSILVDPMPAGTIALACGECEVVFYQPFDRKVDS